MKRKMHQQARFYLLLTFVILLSICSNLQADPDTKDIPVMIITAWADERHIEKASRVGIRHFLAKPFTEDELLREILSLLRDSSRTGP